MELVLRRALPVGRTLLPLAAGVLLLAVLAFVVFPTRAWLDQRRALGAARTQLGVLTDETTRLESRVEELRTNAEIERIAREQYNLVKPGEEAYAVLPPPPPPADVGAIAKVLDAAVFWE